MKNTTLAVLLAVVFSTAHQAKSLTFEFIDGGGTPPSYYVDDGSFTNCIHAAGRTLSLCVRDDHHLKVTYKWGPVGGGQHVLIAYDQSGRETECEVTFNNLESPGTFRWYFDPNPLKRKEGSWYVEEPVYLGTNRVIGSRMYAWPDDSGRADLYWAALHEIGHGLGLSYGLPRFMDEAVDRDIDLTPPTLCAGEFITLKTNVYGVTSHTKPAARAVTSGGVGSGERPLPSELDLLAWAEMGQFTDINRDLSPELTVEPATIEGANVITLSWIQPLGDHRVQACTDLATGDWVTLTNVPVCESTDGNYKVRIPADGVHSFFRLIRLEENGMSANSFKKDALKAAKQEIVFQCEDYH